ncbi:hypothetical protein CIHG_06619 [Coccidioides immitis H538.4]|uniref:Uncharacterized protein n=1 Tax=Coccidioides immitis H538.4 TaxID=396776 RepID=A0A0J8RV79_COCIT|nr:hypothetical protein CIHG_06619 [Coccidioides immitis H538.4]
MQSGRKKTERTDPRLVGLRCRDNGRVSAKDKSRLAAAATTDVRSAHKHGTATPAHPFARRIDGDDDDVDAHARRPNRPRLRNLLGPGQVFLDSPGSGDQQLAAIIRAGVDG